MKQQSSSRRDRRDLARLVSSIKKAKYQQTSSKKISHELKVPSVKSNAVRMPSDYCIHSISRWNNLFGIQHSNCDIVSALWSLLRLTVQLKKICLINNYLIWHFEFEIEPYCLSSLVMCLSKNEKYFIIQLLRSTVRV